MCINIVRFHTGILDCRQYLFNKELPASCIVKISAFIELTMLFQEEIYLKEIYLIIGKKIFFIFFCKLDKLKRTFVLK